MKKNSFNSGINKLKKDKYFGKVIDKMDIPFFPKENDYFQSLIKFIIYQQLSIKVARKIYIRLISLFNKQIINPQNFQKISRPQLRSIGISKSKITYMSEVADTFIKDKFFLLNIHELSNQQIIDMLTTIKGIGPWTADMFLMFTLHRLDVFPIKDLGIKKGIQKLFNLDVIPSDEYMVKKSKQWSPYRTIVSLYLWKLIDGNDFDW